MKVKKLALGAFVLLLVSSSVLADWVTKVDSDAFSKSHTAMMYRNENRSHGIKFYCSNDGLRVAYIEKAGTKKVTEGIPAVLIFKTDGNYPIKLSGRTAIRNADYIGIEAENPEELPKLLSQISKTKKNILVGVKLSLSDKKMIFSINPSGSSSAVNIFVKACNIRLPA